MRSASCLHMSVIATSHISWLGLHSFDLHSSDLAIVCACVAGFWCNACLLDLLLWDILNGLVGTQHNRVLWYRRTIIKFNEFSYWIQKKIIQKKHTKKQWDSGLSQDLKFYPEGAHIRPTKGSGCGMDLNENNGPIFVFGPRNLLRYIQRTWT